GAERDAGARRAAARAGQQPARRDRPHPAGDAERRRARRGGSGALDADPTLGIAAGPAAAVAGGTDVRGLRPCRSHLLIRGSVGILEALARSRVNRALALRWGRLGSTAPAESVA